MTCQTLKDMDELTMHMLNEKSESEKLHDSNYLTFWIGRTKDTVERLMVTRSLDGGEKGWMDEALGIIQGDETILYDTSWWVYNMIH